MMYRHFTVHIESDDPDIDARLARAIGESQGLIEHTDVIELHETVPPTQNNPEGDVFIAAWEV